MRKLILLSATALMGLSAPAHAVTLLYNDFSNTTGLQINGNAAAVNDGARDVLRVTPSNYNQAGSVFSTDKLVFGANYGFSTKFTFNFNTLLNGGADGLVFVIQPDSNTVGAAGGGIGYQGIANSIGIEFDNWDNGFYDGNSDNRVGINLGGNIASVALADPGFVMDNGGDLTAWIDYNGTSLEVRLAQSDVRPLSALLSYDFDLAATIGAQEAYVGFTSGTGAAGANHDLVSWEFRDKFDPIQPAVPEPATWAMMLAGFGTVGFAMRRRQKVAVRFA